MPKTKSEPVVNVSKKKLIAYVKAELKAAVKNEKASKRNADYPEADFQKTQGIVYDNLLARIKDNEFDI